MKINTVVLGVALAAGSFTCTGVGHAEGIKKISFFLTNDIHGHLEPRLQKDGKPIGGLATFKSIVDTVRRLPEYTNGDAALFVLDSGDQFQGTFTSSRDHGKSVFTTMNAIGYDAAIPGTDENELGPSDQMSVAKFPFLSANTFLKKTDSPNSECTATHPAFLNPYVILEKAGIRVGIIGLQHASQSKHLCFRDEAKAYLEVRKSLEGKADLFVLLVHNGNSENTKEASILTQKINETYPRGVDLVAAGFTHSIHDDSVNGVHVLQNGADGQRYGRVDLYLDTDSGEVLKEETASAAGMEIYPSQCDFVKHAFACNQLTFPIKPDVELVKLAKEAKIGLGIIANHRLAKANESIKTERVRENSLGNLLSDALREESGAQIALLSSRSIHANIESGVLTYGKLFEVLPFSTSAVLIPDLRWSSLKMILTKAIQNCGHQNGLNVSGLRVRFSRECGKEESDPRAKLLRVERLGGEVLFDSENAKEVPQDQTFKVVSDENSIPELKPGQTLGLLRDFVAKHFEKSNPFLKSTLDGRMSNASKVADPEL